MAILSLQITEYLLLELKNDKAIKQYCQKEFSQDLLLMVGADVTNPPSGVLYPILGFDPVLKVAGSKESEFEYQLLLRLLIKGDDKPSLSDENILRYEGVYQVETLGDLIVKAINKAISKTNLDMYSVEFFHDEIAHFPLYSGAIVLGFSTPQFIGGGCFEILQDLQEQGENDG